MGTIARHEFLGSKLLLVVLFLTGVGIPIGLLYLIESMVTIEEEIEDPTRFLHEFRAGTFKR